MARLALLSALLAAAVLARDAAAQIDPRREMEIVERALDSAVRKVSRSGAMQAPGLAELCRSYRLEGYGVVFVLPPRVLPRPRLGRLLQGQSYAEAIQTLEAALERVPPSPIREDMVRRLQALKQAQQKPGDADGQPLFLRDPQRAREIRRLEQEALAMASQAAVARDDADKAIADVREQVRLRFEVEVPPPAAAASPAPPQSPTDPATAPARPETPLAPPPPWALWFEAEVPDLRPPQRILQDVRSAVVDTLESVGPRLTSVGIEDHVVVAVDFVPDAAFGPWSRPERTLVVRVRQKELVERAHGQIAADELRRRMEIKEY